MSKFQELSSLIWSVADDVLRGFSKNVYDIIGNFQLDKPMEKLLKNKRLFPASDMVITKSVCTLASYKDYLFTGTDDGQVAWIGKSGRVFCFNDKFNDIRKKSGKTTE